MNSIRFLVQFIVAFIALTSLAIADLLRGMSPLNVRILNRNERRASTRTARPRYSEAMINLRQQRAWFDVSTVADMNGLFSKIYEDAIFVAREETLMTMLVTTYSAKGMGNRVLPIYPQLTAQVVAEGVDYAAGELWDKTSQMELTPQKIKAQSLLTDERMDTDPDNAQRDCTFELGRAISEKMDSDLVDLFSGFSASKGNGTVTLTLSNVAAAIAKLDTEKAKGEKSVVLHPYGWHDIWVALGQPATNAAFLGETANKAMQEYFVSRQLGVNWYRSANIDIDATPTAVGAVFHKEALAFDVRTKPTFEPERDASRDAWELNMTARYAVGERRDTFGVKILHDATEPT